jgi:class 3 adenylate cyclase
MFDVSRWLADQGLGHHAEAFARNGIAGDVLRDLTDADLTELGLNLGDRKRLLKTIAALDAKSTQDRAAEPSAAAAVPREAERRQLTVMFIDLVGSTVLSARLDPEDMSSLIRAYQSVVVGEIARFEGHVAKFMGDGVLAYFGQARTRTTPSARSGRASPGPGGGGARSSWTPPITGFRAHCRARTAARQFRAEVLIAAASSSRAVSVSGQPKAGWRISQSRRRML